MRATRTLRPVGRCQRQSVLSTAHWPESRAALIRWALWPPPSRSSSRAHSPVSPGVHFRLCYCGCAMGVTLASDALAAFAMVPPCCPPLAVSSDALQSAARRAGLICSPRPHRAVPMSCSPSRCGDVRRCTTQARSIGSRRPPRWSSQPRHPTHRQRVRPRRLRRRARRSRCSCLRRKRGRGAAPPPRCALPLLNLLHGARDRSLTHWRSDGAMAVAVRRAQFESSMARRGALLMDTADGASPTRQRAEPKGSSAHSAELHQIAEHASMSEAGATRKRSSTASPSAEADRGTVQTAAPTARRRASLFFGQGSPLLEAECASPSTPAQISPSVGFALPCRGWLGSH
jgi:hypothetical protein